MPARKPTSSLPVRRVDEREPVDDYVFPDRIVLDEESFAKFSADLERSPKPNAALRAMFRR